MNQLALAGAIGDDRNPSSHQACPAHFGGLQGARIQDLAPGEIPGGDQGGAVAMAGIAIVVVDIDAVVDQDSGAAPALPPASVKTSTIPGVVGFARRQRDPTVVSEPGTRTDPNPSVTVIAEKGHQRRLPIVTGVVGAGVPAPTETGMAEPAPVVVGSPAPGVVTDPGPAIEVYPDPSTVPIGGPTHGYRGKPAAAVAGNVGPTAIIVQVLDAVYAGVHVAVGLGLHELPVPLQVPEVPVVLGIGLGNLEFDTLIPLADDHAFTGFERFPAVGRGDLGPSFAHGDRHHVDTDDFDPIAPVLLRAYRRQGGFDVDVGIAAPQFAVGDDPTLELNPEGSVGQVGQSDRGVFVEAHKIGVVQLDFGTGCEAGSQNVGFHQRHIGRGLNRISRFTSLRGHVALDQAEPGDAQCRTGLLRPCQCRVIERHGSEGKQNQNSASTCHG